MLRLFEHEGERKCIETEIFNKIYYEKLAKVKKIYNV